MLSPVPDVAALPAAPETPGSAAIPPAGPEPEAQVKDTAGAGRARPRGESKTARFLALVEDRYGDLAAWTPSKVGPDRRGPGARGRSQRRRCPVRSAAARPRRAGWRCVMTLAVTVLIGLAVLALLGRGLVWAYVPHRQLPGNRVRHNRLRLRLRLHPGRGHATVFALWLHWGRFAAFRGSGRSRRSLSIRQRIAAGSLAYSIVVGRAHHRHGVRVPLEEHVLVMAPPRSGKTGWLARVIIALSRAGAVDDHPPGRLCADQRPARPPRPYRRVQPAGHRRDHRYEHVPVVAG